MKNENEILNNLISQYINLQLEYVKFTNYMKSSIENLMIDHDIHYQSITSRVKNVESLKNKLQGLLKHINEDIRNVNDLSGIRIIMYDRDEEEKIINILSENYNIEYYSPPRENYDSKNYTVSLKNDNLSKFENMKCEIQIVVILSHALIEFGHDIFYKDTEELKLKDQEEYNNLNLLYEEAFEKVIQLETTMKNIRIRANNIKIGYNAINKIIDIKYLNEIEKADGCSKINKIIDDFESIIEPLSKSKESMELIVNNKMLLKIVQAFINIKDAVYDDNEVFYFGTFSYTYDRLVELLRKYIYLWQEDFNQIIEMLMRYLLDNSNNKRIEKLSEMLKNMLKNDKINNNYSLHRAMYEWIISNPTDMSEFKLELATEFCKLDLNYSENSGFRQIRLCQKTVNPGEKYVANIKKIITVYSNYYVRTMDIKIFNKLKSICRMERNYGESKNNFKVEHLMSILSKEFDKLDTHIRWELFKYGKEQEGDIFYKSEIYKKIKSDKNCKLYSYLFSYLLDDIPTKKREIVEEERKKFLNNYIRNFNSENEKDIIDICKNMDTYEEILLSNYYNVSYLLYKIGKEYSNAVELYELTDNVYILLGIYESAGYKIKIIQDSQIEKILKYELMNKSIFSTRLFDEIIKKYKIGYNEKIDNYICRNICSNNNLLMNKKYIDIFIDIVQIYNDKNKSVLNNCSYICEKKGIIKKIGRNNLRLILNNISYKIYIDFNDEIFINKVFEVYPGIVREYIAKRVKNISKVQHRITYYPLYKCENHEKELSNNVLFCLRLLEKYDYYKISEIIRSLIGHYDDKVFEILKSIIQEKKYLKEIVELLRVLDVSLQGWNAFELIISVSDDEEIYREIDTILFSVFGTGEHGISDSFNQKYNFFNKLPINSDTNSNVKEYIKRQKLRFKKLAQSERLKETQRIIEEKTEYEISTKKSTSKDEEE